MRKIQLLFVFCGLVLSIGCAVPNNGPVNVNTTISQYSQQDIEYFLKIALEVELALNIGRNNPLVVKKWQSDIRIQMHGQYTATDEQELNIIINELRSLTGLSITRVHNGPANINIYFVPEDNFAQHIPGYDTNNNQMGIFYCDWNPSNYIIYKATIGVDTILQGVERRHILREELTGSLGLLNDADWYPNSIFQTHTEYTPTQYAPIDKKIIRLLYDPRIRPGMHQQDIYLALNNPPPAHGNRPPVILASNSPPFRSNVTD